MKYSYYFVCSLYVVSLVSVSVFVRNADKTGPGKRGQLCGGNGNALKTAMRLHYIIK